MEISNMHESIVHLYVPTGFMLQLICVFPFLKEYFTCFIVNDFFLSILVSIWDKYDCFKPS